MQVVAHGVKEALLECISEAKLKRSLRERTACRWRSDVCVVERRRRLTAMRSSAVFQSLTAVVVLGYLSLALPALSAFNARCPGRNYSSPSSLWAASQLCAPYGTFFRRTLHAAAGIVVARYLTAVLLAPLYRKRTTWRRTLQKPLSYNAFKLAYFILTTSWTVYAIYSASGGAGKDHPSLLLRLPHGRDPLAESVARSRALSSGTVDYAVRYLCLSAGFHVASLIFFCFEDCGAGGGPETPVQVALALGLIVGAFLGQHFALGTTLLALHDFCDILTSLTKCLINLRKNRAAVVSALLLTAAWIYVRLLSFGRFVLLPILELVVERKHRFPQDAEPLLFATMLLCLLFLNIYWFSLMLRSFTILLRSGAVTDAHAPQEAVAEEDNKAKSS